MPRKIARRGMDESTYYTIGQDDQGYYGLVLTPAARQAKTSPTLLRNPYDMVPYYKAGAVYLEPEQFTALLAESEVAR